MISLDLFAGVGGGLLAGVLLGWTCAGAVEIDPYRRAVLRSRQEDGSLGRFPIRADIRDFDARPFRGKVDVITGGFPCQGFSAAGSRAGFDDPRSGLWREMLRVIREVMPSFVLAENSPRLRFAGLSVVLEDLAGLGYDAAWLTLGARHVGAPHARDRLWVLATDPNQVNGPRGLAIQPHRSTPIFERGDRECLRTELWGVVPSPIDPRVGDGVADRVGRSAAIGDGQVPLVAAVAWSVLRGLT